MDKFYACGIIYNPKENTVLLQKRDDKAEFNPNRWCFFGGSNEGNEKPIDTFIREIKEELNIDLILSQLKIYREYFNEEHQSQRYVYLFETELTKNEMKLGEGADFDWIPLDKVLGYDLTIWTRHDLEDFIKNNT